MRAAPGLHTAAPGFVVKLTLILSHCRRRRLVSGLDDSAVHAFRPKIARCGLQQNIVVLPSLRTLSSPITSVSTGFITDYFSGPGRAIGRERVFVRPGNNF